MAFRKSQSLIQILLTNSQISRDSAKNKSENLWKRRAAGCLTTRNESWDECCMTTSTYSSTWRHKTTDVLLDIVLQPIYFKFFDRDGCIHSLFVGLNLFRLKCRVVYRVRLTCTKFHGRVNVFSRSFTWNTMTHRQEHQFTLTAKWWISSPSIDGRSSVNQSAS